MTRRSTKPTSGNKKTTYWKPKRRTTGNRPKTRYSSGTRKYGQKRTNY